MDYSYRIKYRGLLASFFLSSLERCARRSTLPGFELIITVSEVSRMVLLLVFIFFTTLDALCDFPIFVF